MKKIIYSLSLAVAMLLVFTGCSTKEEDNVFGESSATRMAKALKEDAQLLTSASNGWLMKFYADTKYGGYNVYCKFRADSTVEISNEMYGTEAPVTSHYTLGQSQGVILSFDTYNKNIHVFSDPDASVSGIGTSGKGMLGDFEFRIQSASADSVVMLGKKHGSKVVMQPMSSGTSWNAFYSKISTIIDDVDSYNTFNLVVDGEDITTTKKDYHSFTFTDPDTGNTIEMPYLVKETGLELHTPLTYRGKQITGFTYSKDGKWLNPADNSVALMPTIPPLSTQFKNGDWYLCNSAMYSNIYWKTWIANVYPDLVSSIGEVGLLCFTPNKTYSALFWNVGDYVAYLNFDVEVVEDDKIKLTYNGSGNDNGTFLYENWDFNYITKPFEGNTFIITTDNPKKPKTLILTDVTDPTKVITLSGEFIENPFDN